MRIGISGYAADGGRSGISQYFSNIVGRLPDLAPEDRFLVFVNRSEAPWVRTWHPAIEVVEHPDWTAHPIAGIFWHLVALPRALRRHRCTLAFLPAGNRRLGLWYGMPSVGTVHDLSQLHVPTKYDRLRMAYILRLLPALMRRLDRVISVSDSTRRDLLSFARVPDARIRVVPNGADLTRFRPMNRTAAQAEVASIVGTGAPYFLYVARLEHPGKNHVRLLEAFARLRAERALPHRLVLAGGRWNGAEVIEARARDLGLGEAVVFAGFVPDERLPALYAGAEALVFPSLFEGFGIPLLEAMACGTPVCASGVSSIPEVVGDAGLLFDPADPAAIAAAMGRLAEDPALREGLAAAGLRQAARFTWEAAALGVLGVLREAAGK